MITTKTKWLTEQKHILVTAFPDAEIAGYNIKIKLSVIYFQEGTGMTQVQPSDINSLTSGADKLWTLKQIYYFP